MSYHRHPKSDYYVYFARAGDMMKIGCSRQPIKRLSQIGEWIPFKISLAAVVHGAFDLESALHSHFGASWSHLEWFRITPEMEAMVADINAGRPIQVERKPRNDLKEFTKTLKKRASRRVSFAEDKARPSLHSWDCRALRPPYLKEALKSFKGPHSPPPSPTALAAIARYENELRELTQESVAA